MADNAKAQGRSTPVEKDWIAAARTLLIEGGVAAVQVKVLAQRLGVTRGGFFWRFRNRATLLEHLLLDWEDTNTRAFVGALRGGGTPQERFNRVVRLWIDEEKFLPGFDMAVRQWGAISPEVRARVEASDQQRIDAFAEVFADAGEPPLEALIRARINYFHQIGYYALGIQESRERRRELVDIYNRMLTGWETRILEGWD